MNQERYGEAESLLKQALEICKKQLTEKHPDVLNMFNNLAALYFLQGRYLESEILSKQILELYEKQLIQHLKLPKQTNLCILRKQ